MMLYYCVKHTFDMGAVFTASHNPPEWVGMKIVNNESLLIESAELSSWVEEYTPVTDDIDEDDFERVFLQATGEENPLYLLIEEKITSLSALYGERFSDLEKKYTFVVDCSNGAAVGYEKIFLEEIVSLS
jgi:phosphomannomutase